MDRIVIPAVEMKADKVYLLVHDNKTEDKATLWIKDIKKESGEQSLLGDPKLILSRQRKLQNRTAQLSEIEQKQLTKLIES